MGLRPKLLWPALLVALAAGLFLLQNEQQYKTDYVTGIEPPWKGEDHKPAAKNGDAAPTEVEPYERPEGHVRNALPGLGCEDPNYGMYTYVLYRWNTETCASKAGCEKLKLLLSYLGNLRPGEDAADQEPARLNSFYVPVRVSEDGQTLSLENYDHRLADRILRKFARAVEGQTPELAARLADDERPGPFLISTLRPIRELAATAGKFPMLSVDLGGEELESIPEYYKAYRHSLEERHFGSAEQFKSLELALLNAGLHALRACRIVYGNVLALVGD